MIYFLPVVPPSLNPGFYPSLTASVVSWVQAKLLSAAFSVTLIVLSKKILDVVTFCGEGWAVIPHLVPLWVFFCYHCEWAQGEISLQPAFCVLFISYIENQGGLENITEMDLVNYRELRNLWVFHRSWRYSGLNCWIKHDAAVFHVFVATQNSSISHYALRGRWNGFILLFNAAFPPLSQHDHVLQAEAHLC